MEADAIEAADDEDSHRASSGAVYNVKPLPAVSHGCLSRIAFCSPNQGLTRLEAATATARLHWRTRCCWCSAGYQPPSLGEHGDIVRQSAELAEHGQHGLQAPGSQAGPAEPATQQAEPEQAHLGHFQGTTWMRIRAVLSQGVSVTSNGDRSDNQGGAKRHKLQFWSTMCVIVGRILMVALSAAGISAVRCEPFMRSCSIWTRLLRSWSGLSQCCGRQPYHCWRGSATAGPGFWLPW